MHTGSMEKGTKKSARVPKNVNGHAAVAADAVPASPATADESRAEAGHAKTAKKALAAKGDAVPATVVTAEKAKRPKKEKVVRDSFTMPKSDYDKIGQLKQKCLDAGVAVKKSELLRAGLLLLDSTPAKRLIEAVSAIETVKTGRPAKV